MAAKMGALAGNLEVLLAGEMGAMRAVATEAVRVGEETVAVRQAAHCWS